jgi:NAD(P)-dependent dehydrogenase (short-subunit alcohol dehydrogenase family)
LSIIGVECDVSSESSVQKAFAEVIDTFGRIDAVVASAGKFHPRDTTSNVHRLTGIVENYPALE